MTPQLPPLPNSRRIKRLWWSAWLVVSLLLAQTLGLLHAVQHGEPSTTRHTVVQAHAHAHESHHHDGFLEQLFSSHSSSSDCRLYDQAGSSHALPSVAVAMLPIVLPPTVVALFHGEAIARWAALFNARGPPLTS